MVDMEGFADQGDGQQCAPQGQKIDEQASPVRTDQFHGPDIEDLPSSEGKMTM